MRKPCTLLLFLLFTTAVSAVEVTKSPNDDRQYEYLELPNRMRVLLVSDPEADKAAAALTVGVGSTSDPPGRDGLAHFLEHMLFMGTEQYPDVDDYSDFIKKNGGMDNAFTAGGQTTYYFDIKPEALEPALDRFAQFFIAPLMDARYVEREKHAVESEYQLKLKDDTRRIGAAQEQSYNPKSPWSRFFVGSLETLEDRPGHPVREDLLKFYRTHYSSNIMGLTVVGKEPLPVLRKWVMEKFAAVPDRHASRWRPEYSERVYLPEQLPVEISVVPLKKLHKLGLSFVLPSTLKQYRELPLYYISHFIEDEGKGSLHSLLRSKGWLTSLSASGDNLDDAEAVFSVEMDLTEEGMKHEQEILQAFFAYVDLLRIKGIDAWRYAELSRKTALDFRFEEKRGVPSDYAVALSGKLLDYPPADVLVAGNLLQHYDPDLIRKMLDQLRPENLSLTRVQQGLRTDRVEGHYQVAYSVRKDRPRLERANWQLVAPLALPEPNPFMPEHVELKPIAAHTAIPQRLQQAKGMNLWHQQDDEFGVPRSVFVANFEFPMANDTPEHAVELQLFIDLVNDQLNEYAYTVSMAGLGYALGRTSKGMLLLLYGYDDKQSVLLSKILEVLSWLDFSQERFDVFKRKLARELENEAMDRPVSKMFGVLDRTLVKPSWSPKQQLAALQDVDLEKLYRYVWKLFRRAELNLLAYGNLTAQEARSMGQLLRQKLLASTRLRPIPDPVVKKLEPQQPQRVRFEVDHPDSLVASYFQGASKALEEQARWQLLAQVLQNDFYTALRTEQQLGYIVATFSMELENMPGLLFLVQSSVASASEVEERIDDFIAAAGWGIESMSEAEFQAHKAGLISKLRKKDQNTMERALRYMDNLDRKQQGFDYRHRLADIVAQLDRDSLLAFYRQRLLKKPRHLVVYSPGTRFPDK